MIFAEYIDPDSPGEVHTAHTEDLPGLPMPEILLRKVGESVGSSLERYLSLSFEISYDEPKKVLLLKGLLKEDISSKDSIVEHEAHINPESFAADMYRHLTKESSSTPSLLSLHSFDDAVNRIIEHVAIKLFAEKRILLTDFIYDGKGFIFENGSKIALFESLRFDTNGTKTKTSTGRINIDILDVYSNIDLSAVEIIDAYASFYVFGAEVRIPIESIIPSDREFYLYNGSVELEQAPIRDIVIKDTQENDYLEQIQDKDERIHHRLSFLDSLIEEKEDPFERFSEIL